MTRPKVDALGSACEHVWYTVRWRDTPMGRVYWRRCSKCGDEIEVDG